MSKYIHNPKTEGSGIVCAIPQTGNCPNNCADCFFQSGRSYLEPLDKNLPNMPSVEDARGRIVRVNDGNDSNIDRDLVIETTNEYKNRFFNTSIPKGLVTFPAPVVFTVNPSNMTDKDFYTHLIPNNVMFVRIRADAWNLDTVIKPAVMYYSAQSVPIVLTFMAYHDISSIKREYRVFYKKGRRVINSYYKLSQEGWDFILNSLPYRRYVYTCGKDADTHACSECGNCLREYYATKERMNG